MISKYEIPESVVIVTNDNGAVATLHFKTESKSRILSSPNKDSIYKAVEKYVMGEKRNARS